MSECKQNIESNLPPITNLVEVREETLKERLDNLADEERHDLIHKYCIGCGSKNKDCHCMNDE